MRYDNLSTGNDGDALALVWQDYKRDAVDWTAVEQVQHAQSAVCARHQQRIKAHWNGPVCVRCCEERRRKQLGGDNA